MTERLYYDNPYLKEFTAIVTASGREGENCWLRLDRSAFYPTSGGQPHDTGRIVFDGGMAAVTGVEAEEDGDVRHAVDRLVPVGARVRCALDWPRRFDHMQQHLGEHLLAGQIARAVQGHTIGLHIGRDDATIDVTLPGGATRLPEAAWLAIEDAANRLVMADLPVRCWFPAPKELAALPLRKQPSVTTHVRVVAAGDVEMVACGGTHPDTTGQVGMVKVLGAEPVRGKMRVHFVCGMRALRAFRTHLDAAGRAGQLLSAQVSELPQAVQRLRDRLSDSERALRGMQAAAALDALTARLDAAEPLPSGWQVLAHTVPGADMELLSLLAGAALERNPRAIALLHGQSAGRDTFVFACAPHGAADMAQLLRAAGLRGGGRADFARGSAPAGADGAALLRKAQAAVIAQLAERGVSE